MKHSKKRHNSFNNRLTTAQNIRITGTLPSGAKISVTDCQPDSASEAAVLTWAELCERISNLDRLVSEHTKMKLSPQAIRAEIQRTADQCSTLLYSDILSKGRKVFDQLIHAMVYHLFAVVYIPDSNYFANDPNEFTLNSHRKNVAFSRMFRPVLQQYFYEMPHHLLYEMLDGLSPFDIPRWLVRKLDESGYKLNRTRIDQTIGKIERDYNNPSHLQAEAKPHSLEGIPVTLHASSDGKFHEDCELCRMFAGKDGKSRPPSSVTYHPSLGMFEVNRDEICLSVQAGQFDSEDEREAFRSEFKKEMQKHYPKSNLKVELLSSPTEVDEMGNEIDVPGTIQAVRERVLRGDTTRGNYSSRKSAQDQSCPPLTEKKKSHRSARQKGGGNRPLYH